MNGLLAFPPCLPASRTEQQGTVRLLRLWSIGNGHANVARAAGTEPDGNMLIVHAQHEWYVHMSACAAGEILV